MPQMLYLEDYLKRRPVQTRFRDIEFPQHNVTLPTLAKFWPRLRGQEVQVRWLGALNDGFVAGFKCDTPGIWGIADSVLLLEIASHVETDDTHCRFGGPKEVGQLITVAVCSHMIEVD